MSRPESLLTTRGVEQSRAEKHGLTADRLHEVVEYNALTGQFLRRSARGRWPIGSEVGAIDTGGYRCLAIDGVLYKAHRLAVLYMTGEMPPTSLHVDHINRVRHDNAWANLRVVTPKENAANQRRVSAYTYKTKPRRGFELIDRGVELIRQRVQSEQPPQLRATAALLGIDKATLVRACQRAGLVLPRGRPRGT